MTEPRRLLFLTDRGLRHQREAEEASPPGLAVTMLRAPSERAAIEALGDVEILVSERNQPVTRAMIEAAPRLALIVRLGSLAHDLDVRAARAAGVRVSVQPVPSSIVAAEHAVMMTLAAVKRLGRSLAFVARGGPDRAPRRTDEDTFAYNFEGYTDVGALYGRSASILGMGEIGAELARRLRAFSLGSLSYTKRHRWPEAVEAELGIAYATPEAAIASADVLVSLLPYSPETAGSLGAAVFAAMRPGAVLVHAGSGGVVDELALVEALARGRIAGAALDTFEQEPLDPEHPLAVAARDPARNLLLTPHVASGTELADCGHDYAEVVRFLAGQPLRHAVA